MNIIFVHDHKIKVDLERKYYTDGKLTNELFQRYIFDQNDKIKAITRVVIIEQHDTKTLNLVDHPNVFFNPVKGINPLQIFFRNCIYNTKIFKNVIKSDLNIIRLPSFIGLFCCFICILFRKKYFLELVGHARDSLIDHNSSQLLILIAKIYSLFTKFVVKRAAGVIYVTKYALQKDYPTLGISAVASNVVIHIDEVDCPKIQYNVPSQRIFRIGLIGSFNNHYKGIEFAINTVALLRKKNISVNLHILGQGSLLNEYIKLAHKLQVEDLIFFEGILPGGDPVKKWLDKLDLYIQPSLTEGLPRALIEAMSRGLPALASNVGGIPELLDSEYMFSSFDENIFANKILKFIQDEKLRKVCGNNNYLKSKDYDFSKLESDRREFWMACRNLLKEAS